MSTTVEDFNTGFPANFTDDEKFMNWLVSYAPHWELEYTGNIESMYAAWLAGRKLFIDTLPPHNGFTC